MLIHYSLCLLQGDFFLWYIIDVVYCLGKMIKLNTKQKKSNDVEERQVNWKEIWSEHRDKLVERFLPQSRKAYGYMTIDGIIYEIHFDEEYFLYWLSYITYDHLGKNSEWLSHKIKELDKIKRQEKEEQLRDKIKALAKEKYALMGDDAPPLEEIEQNLIEALE